MFCPNCGTKNGDSAAKCSQCGFDLKAKSSPKHKGTVMMKGSPPGLSAAGADRGQKANPGLKGTMVGVAPPDLGDAVAKAKAASPAAQSPAAKKPNPKLKGTMVGVAPPGIEELKKQAAQAAASKPKINPAIKTTAAESPQAKAPANSGASGAVGKPASSAKGPPSKLKGTMIGLAPPDVSAEVEAAKAKLAAQKAAAAAKGEQEKPAEKSSEPEAKPTATGPASKKPPSKLKGTMIGVAPPDMQQQIAAAKEAAAKKDAPAETPAASPPVEDDPPSAPDPLGGTVVGTSPFAPGGPAATATPGATDFSDDTPAAGSQATPGAPVAPTEGTTDPQLHADPAPVAASPAGGGQLHSPLPQQPLPVTKSNTGPILLIVVLLLIVAGGVGYMLMGGTNAEEAPAEDAAAEDAKATPAK